MKGPWGMEDGVGLFDATTHTDAEALYEYACTVDDWQDAALSVEGPLMYHEVPEHPEGMIEPCECDDEHPGQHEVWKVLEQAQEPTARSRERRRWAEDLHRTAIEHQELAEQRRAEAMDAHRDGRERLYRTRMESGKTHRALSDTYYRISQRIGSNGVR